MELLRLHAPGPTRRGLALRPGPQQASPPEGNTQTMQAASWACARPVHLGAGLDHLWLDPSPVPLALQEAREIVATLDATVADRGWSLIALDAERWLVGTRDVVECTTSTPWEAAGREVRMHLPEGRDARLVRAVMNEMQMTLHEHPVNQRRDSVRRQAVNGVWLWGFGAIHAVDVRSLPVLATDDEWLRELWQLHGNPVLATATDALPGTAAVADPALIALGAPSGATGEDRVRHAEQTIFAPLRRALISGELAMHLNSGQSVLAFDRLSARSWRPISTRSAHPSFVTSATRATLPVSRALSATVVPWTTWSPSRAPPSSCKPASIARTGSLGVEGTLATESSSPSARTRSVKVPPVSIPIVRPKRGRVYGL